MGRWSWVIRVGSVSSLGSLEEGQSGKEMRGGKQRSGWCGPRAEACGRPHKWQWNGSFPGASRKITALPTRF